MWHDFLIWQWYPVWPNLEASALWAIPTVSIVLWSHFKLMEEHRRDRRATLSKREKGSGGNEA